MRELSKSFIGRGQVKGFEFTQLEKTKFGYIYKVEHLGRVWYEVFKHKENTKYNVISYPSNKAFGIWAWTTPNLESAVDRLNDITIIGELKD